MLSLRRHSRIKYRLTFTFRATSRLGLAFGGAFEHASLRFRLLAVTRHRPAHPAWSAVSIAAIVLLIFSGATRARVQNRPARLALAQNEVSEDGFDIARIPWDFAMACRELGDGKALASWSTAAFEGLLDLSRDLLSRSDSLPGLRRLRRVTATNADQMLDTKSTISLNSVGFPEIGAQRKNIAGTFLSWSPVG
jgi:hypothetical protein